MNCPWILCHSIKKKTPTMLCILALYRCPSWLNQGKSRQLLYTKETNLVWIFFADLRKSAFSISNLNSENQFFSPCVVLEFPRKWVFIFQKIQQHFQVNGGQFDMKQNFYITLPGIWRPEITRCFIVNMQVC